ncbi:MAG: M36 family metallopeptidase, partial [Myxococcota bacterium]
GDLTPLDPAAVDAPVPPFTLQSTQLVEGLNTNPDGEPDAWLPDGSAETRGNNVDAYADRALPTGFSAGDLRPQVTQPNVFGHVYDPERDPFDGDTQAQAAIINLFYVINWLHDVYYDVGFDEAAGNAQSENFGRGGFAGDRMFAEGLDVGGRNNANMATPADGQSPRMQMFLWDIGTRVVEHGEARYGISSSNYGPLSYDLSAPTRIVDDGEDNTRDGCSPIANDLTDTIALIDRGQCALIDKIRFAQDRGAVGVILRNNRGGGPTFVGGEEDAGITIPTTMVSRGNGRRLMDAEGDEVRMLVSPISSLAGSLDNQVIAHEWGHYIHNRLVRCGNNQCGGMGEGWGDFLAILSFLNEDDLRDAPYPAGSFSKSGRDPVYYGVRRVPYSTSPDFNALSFRHIGQGAELPTEHPLGSGPNNNAQVHNSGEIWASMMFDATWALIDRSREPTPPYDFAGAKRRMMAYVVAGMQLAPENPTYTEQRDGIVLAALASDVEDALAIAEAFAGRGAGTCALSPERFSTDHAGIVEDFEVSPNVRIEGLELSLDAPGTRCDGDGVLDVGEDAELHVRLRNFGPLPLDASTLLVEVSDAALELSFDPSARMMLAGEVALAPLMPGESRELVLPVRLVAPPLESGAPLEIRASLPDESLCDAAPTTLSVTIDADIGTRSAEEAFDIRPPWFEETSLDGRTRGVWAVVPSATDPADTLLRAVNAPTITDTAVVLPPVRVSETEDFVFRFAHRYDFELSDDTFWDGGVIEITRDGGEIWTDIEIPGVFEPGYDGSLSNRAGNPLSNRRAFSGQNASYPEADAVELDFGTLLAGDTVQFRFRVGTDRATGASGWEIDDLAFSGVDAPVFPTYVADTSDCGGAPSVDAGPPQTVFSGEAVILDGGGSMDPDGDALSFSWSARDAEGPALDATDAARVGFLAPDVEEPTTYGFRLTVSDGTRSATADTTVTVLAAPPPPVDMGIPDLGRPDAGVDGGVDLGTDMVLAADMGDAPEASGCGCHVTGPLGAAAGPQAIAFGFLVVLDWRRRRRR